MSKKPRKFTPEVSRLRGIERQLVFYALGKDLLEERLVDGKPDNIYRCVLRQRSTTSSSDLPLLLDLVSLSKEQVEELGNKAIIKEIKSRAGLSFWGNIACYRVSEIYKRDLNVICSEGEMTPSVDDIVKAINDTFFAGEQGEYSMFKFDNKNLMREFLIKTADGDLFLLENTLFVSTKEEGAKRTAMYKVHDYESGYLDSNHVKLEEVFTSKEMKDA